MSLYKYRAKLVRVVDGDTADFNIDLGFHVVIKIRGRFGDIDTPERGEKDFALATEKLSSLIKEKEDAKGYIEILTEKTGKYGRWIVYIAGVNEVLKETWPYYE